MRTSRYSAGLVIVSACAAMAIAAPVSAQSAILETYLGNHDTDVLRKDASEEAVKPKDGRDANAIVNLLPMSHSNSFVQFVARTNSFRDMLRSVDATRLNKLLASAPGMTGTSLVSQVAAPAVIGAAVEYGSVLQQTTGATTTLRGNLLGLARLMFGVEQFPYCPQISASGCAPMVRRLRALSGSVGFENTRAAPAAATAQSPPTAAALLGDEYRVASVSARLDLTPSNNLDDPKYVRAWTAAIAALRGDPTVPALTEAVSKLFDTAVGDETYTAWMADTTRLLMAADPGAAFYDVLEQRLTLLVDEMQKSDPEFARNVGVLNRAYQNYFDVRDGLIREAQVRKLSLEYTNRRPLNQPSTSNVRLIFSHQPTAAPAIITLNAAVTWYDARPSTTTTAIRDAQFAAEIDRRLGEIPQFGQAVLSFAGYYQWMKEDAAITSASILPATKGHIGVVQGKLTMSLSDVVKVPLSVTWSNRRELVKEQDLRGQVGLTLDLDTLFR